MGRDESVVPALSPRQILTPVSATESGRLIVNATVRHQRGEATAVDEPIPTAIAARDPASVQPFQSRTAVRGKRRRPGLTDQAPIRDLVQPRRIALRATMYGQSGLGMGVR